MLSVGSLFVLDFGKVHHLRNFIKYKLKMFNHIFGSNSIPKNKHFQVWSRLFNISSALRIHSVGKTNFIKISQKLSGQFLRYPYVQSKIGITLDPKNYHVFGSYSAKCKNFSCLPPAGVDVQPETQ